MSEPFIKEPNEIVTLGFDFTAQLPEDVTIDEGTVSSKNSHTLEDSTSEIIVDTDVVVEEGGKIVKFGLQDGAHGANHYVTVVVTLSDGQVWEENRKILIRDLRA